MASPEVSVRWPMAPRSLIVRTPILIPFPLIAAPLPPLTALYRPLPPGSMRHERQLHDLCGHALAPDVDLEAGAGLHLLPRQVGHADRGVGGGRDGAAADHVHLAAVEIDPVTVAGHALRLAHPEPDEPALDALQPLPPQGGGPDGVRALLELPDPAEARLEGGDRGVDVVAVERVTRLEPQRVAGAQPARLAAPRSHERQPQSLEVRAAAIQLEAVLARVAGAGEEALDAGDLARGEVVVGDHRRAERRERRGPGLRPGPLHREQPGLVRD